MRMVEGDLDHHHVGRVVTDQMRLSDDDKVLYALIFSQSYRNHVAMITLQLFPELLKVSNDRIVEWHDQNWQRLKFAKDTKWGVRKFPAFIESIRTRFGTSGLYEKFRDISNSGTTKENYYRLNSELQSLFGMGRMTAWLAQQTLYEFFGWDIDYWDQQLYDTATWSQWGALAYLFNRPDLLDKSTQKNNTNVKVMEDYTIHLMEYVNEKINFHVDIYNIESCECEFRKTAQKNPPREYTGWTSQELLKEFPDLLEAWSGINIDWDPYITGFMTKGKNVLETGCSPEYFPIFQDTGLNLNTHWIYKDEPDAFKLLGITRKHSDGKLLMDSMWKKSHSVAEQKKLRTQYNPTNFLKYK